MIRHRLLVPILGLLALVGCAQPNTADLATTPAAPDYSRPLAPGAPALRLVADPARVPIGDAWHNRDAFTLDALDESRLWYEAPSSRQFFPIEGITHEQARASLLAFQELIELSVSEDDFINEFRTLFDLYESV